MISNASSNSARIKQLASPAIGGVGEDALHGSSDMKRLEALPDGAGLELIRDVVAIANSGGGVLRVDCDGRGDLSASAIVQQIAQYADTPFADVSVALPEGAATTSAEIIVGPAEFPIGFRRSAPRAPSSRLADEESAFAAGMFYFRHDEQSLPGTSADLRAFFLRMLSRVRRRWLRQVRRLLSKPIESVTIKGDKSKNAPPKTTSTANLQPVRIVNDPAAPALQPQDVDHLYPWRQKHLVQELNTRLGRRALTTYDIQAVRRQHGLDERPDFVFHLEGAGRRYSPAVADWIMDQFGADREFFHQARAADQAMLRLRRQKPR